MTVAGAAWTRVYPRVCGGTGQVIAADLTAEGLSPRVRGNRVSTPPICRTRRSIPACAGEPNILPPVPCQPPVYPRVCGGTMPAAAARMPAAGLSPRVRGNPLSNQHHQAGGGSIPACAGEPIWPSDFLPHSRVYPRVCGGTKNLCRRNIAKCGLSPRVRGNRPRPCVVCRLPRSIPACAGEPHTAVGLSSGISVYPRVCGGTNWPGVNAWRPQGLSPRVRGNLPLRRSRRRRLGSIPACAGEPRRRSLSQRIRWVYPRVCGGTHSLCRRSLLDAGLSPRVRGNPGRRYRHVDNIWSIPACAGEPLPLHGAARLRGVYPRVCGGSTPTHHHGERL